MTIGVKRIFTPRMPDITMIAEKIFMSKRNVASSHSKLVEAEDMSLLSVIQMMESDRLKVWSSRWRIIDNIKEHFGEHIIVLSSPGIADILMFKTVASNILKIETDDDGDVDTRQIAKKIVR